MSCYDAKYGIGRFGISRYGSLCLAGDLIYNNTSGVFKKKLDPYSDTSGITSRKIDAYANSSGIYKKKLKP